MSAVVLLDKGHEQDIIYDYEIVGGPFFRLLTVAK